MVLLKKCHLLMDCRESMQLKLQFCYFGNGLAGPFISIYHYCQYGIFIGIGYRFLQLRYWHPFLQTLTFNFNVVIFNSNVVFHFNEVYSDACKCLSFCDVNCKRRLVVLGLSSTSKINVLSC